MDNSKQGPMFGVNFVMMDGSTYTESGFLFRTLEELVVWSQDALRQKSWRMLGIAAVVPVSLEG